MAAGAARPRISSVERLRTALLGARAITYTKPGSPRFSMEAQMVDGLLKRPGFSDVHAMPALENPVWPFWRRVMPTWRCRWYRRSSLHWRAWSKRHRRYHAWWGRCLRRFSMHINVAASVFAHSGDRGARVSFHRLYHPPRGRTGLGLARHHARENGSAACRVRTCSEQLRQAPDRSGFLRIVSVAFLCIVSKKIQYTEGKDAHSDFTCSGDKLGRFQCFCRATLPVRLPRASPRACTRRKAWAPLAGF